MPNKKTINSVYVKLLNLQDSHTSFCQNLKKILQAVIEEESDSSVRKLKLIKQIVAGFDRPEPKLIDFFTTPVSRYMGVAFALNYRKYIDNSLLNEMREVAKIEYSKVNS